MLSGANCLLDFLGFKGTHRGLFAASLTTPDALRVQLHPCLMGLALALEYRRIALFHADIATHPYWYTPSCIVSGQSLFRRARSDIQMQ